MLYIPQACIRDLEETTQRRLFSERYLQLDPERVTENTFESFKTFFESVNVQGGPDFLPRPSLSCRAIGCVNDDTS